MSNALARHAGFSATPWLLGTLVKHYFDHLFSDKAPTGGNAKLRGEEILYDEAFHIVKVCRIRLKFAATPKSVNSRFSTFQPSTSDPSGLVSETLIKPVIPLKIYSVFPMHGHQALPGYMLFDFSFLCRAVMTQRHISSRHSGERR